VVRDLETVRVFSPTPDHREQFAREMDSYLDASVTAVEDSETAVRDADIVITSTTSPEPVFDGEHLSDGAHVTAMGQYHPEKRELDTRTIERATYVPDLVERVTQDAGAFIQAMSEGAVTEEDVHGELGSVLVGDVPGRTGEDEITVFDSGGTAIETVAGAYLLYEKAVDEGLGDTVDFSPASEGLTGKQV
jgi:alanine dehydrogenase